MADTWWTPAISGAAGILGALVGAGATHLGAKGREERAWRRQRKDKLDDIRARLYLDLTEFLESLFNQVAYEPDDVSQLGRIPDVQSRERLNARVDLYGEERLREAWREALMRYDMIEAEWRDNGQDDDVSAETKGDATRAIDQAQKLLRELVNDVDR